MLFAYANSSIVNIIFLLFFYSILLSLIAVCKVNEKENKQISYIN